MVKFIVYTLIYFLLIILYPLVLNSQSLSEDMKLIFRIDTPAQNEVLLGSLGASLIDSEKNVYLVDNGNKKIHHFDENGRYVKSFSGEGRGPGEFMRTTSATLSQDEEILYIIDYTNVRINSYDVQTGEHLSTIALQSTIIPTNAIFSFGEKILLLGSHQRVDSMVNEIDHNGETVESTGNFIDFSSFVHNNAGKMQLSIVYASALENQLFVTLAAPKRAKIFDRDLNLVHEFESDFLPTPWETHMTMRPDRFRTRFYSMGADVLLLSEDAYLFHWLEIIDPDGPVTKRHLELRSTSDGELLSSHPIPESLSLLGLQRKSETSAYLLTRNSETFDFEIYELSLR